MEGMDQESRREDSTLDQTFRLQTVYFRLLVYVTFTIYVEVPYMFTSVC